MLPNGFPSELSDGTTAPSCRISPVRASSSRFPRFLRTAIRTFGSTDMLTLSKKTTYTGNSAEGKIVTTKDVHPTNNVLSRTFARIRWRISLQLRFKTGLLPSGLVLRCWSYCRNKGSWGCSRCHLKMSCDGKYLDVGWIPGASTSRKGRLG